MLIANPIYDAVFKYLLSDLKVAKLLLSTLLEKEITHLDFLPTEITSKSYHQVQHKDPTLQSHIGLSYFRIDFAANIKLPNGDYQHVIIELQKARLITTLKRFRTYLGEQYRNPNLYQSITTPNGKTYEASIPIYAIYILGYTLDEYEDTPVLEIELCLKDKYTKKIYQKTDNFVRSLFHEGLVVLVPNLKGKYRSQVERMLRIFEDSVGESGMHLLEINAEEYPEELRPIIYRLQKAVVDESVSRQMEAEDEIFEEIRDREVALLKARREAEEAEKKAEQERKEKEEAKQRAERERKEKEEAIKRAEEAKQKAERERKEKEETHKRLQKAVILMKDSGLAIAHIAAALGISEDEVQMYLT
ncbi:MAG: hypothetical protein NZ521_02360 [Flammeovirgaceae bacterium]|nr:hypothetical protein [Flammeovirgaceae bacterium]